MNIKIITGFLLGSLLASTHLDAEPDCKDPKELLPCLGNQDPLAINGCVKLEAAPRKNKDCTGPDGKKFCSKRTLELSTIKTTYIRLNVSDSKKALDSTENTEIYCGTEEATHPVSVPVKCLDAILGSNCDGTGTGS